MPERAWTLHDEPFRHYKATNDKGKETWNGARKQRILSVTDVLDGGQSALLSWAVGNTLVAAEAAAVQWLDAAPALARSVVDFNGLAELTGLMPDSIRDDKAALGTLAHEYLADKLMVVEGVLEQPQRDYSAVPYGYRFAIDEFLADHNPSPVYDDAGPRIERVVGNFELAVAGTYDAQVILPTSSGPPPRHRLDLKSSRSVQAKHFAQVAMYEELALECEGGAPSDYVSILHVTPLGEYKLHSIAYGSDDYRLAVETFHRYLGIRRGEARLAKLIA